MLNGVTAISEEHDSYFSVDGRGKASRVSRSSGMNGPLLNGTGTGALAYSWFIEG